MDNAFNETHSGVSRHVEGGRRPLGEGFEFPGKLAGLVIQFIEKAADRLNIGSVIPLSSLTLIPIKRGPHHFELPDFLISAHADGFGHGSVDFGQRVNSLIQRGDRFG